jgi:hypothetical protein
MFIPGRNVVVDLGSGGTGRLSKLLTGECDVLAWPAASQLTILLPRQKCSWRCRRIYCPARYSASWNGPVPTGWRSTHYASVMSAEYAAKLTKKDRQELLDRQPVGTGPLRTAPEMFVALQANILPRAVFGQLEWTGTHRLAVASFLWHLATHYASVMSAEYAAKLTKKDRQELLDPGASA